MPESFTINNSGRQITNSYLYSANGKKLRVIKDFYYQIDYAGNLIFENNSLKRILVNAGYYEGNTFHYFIKDHLGNNRLVVNQSGAIVQSLQYEPFGMTFADGINAGWQPYKFGGKEEETDCRLNWYDFESRLYVPDLGRFMQPDPMAEKYYSISPYAYCANNPIRYVDLHGDTISFTQDNIQYTYRDGNFWTSKGDNYAPKEGSVMAEVLSVYNKILKSSNKELKHQLKTLEKSKKMHSVREGNGNNVIAYEKSLGVSQQDKLTSEGMPVSTLTRYNFSEYTKGIYKQVEGIEFSVFGMVLHEMQHQYDYDQGNMKDAKYDVPGAKRPQEIRAVQNENIARAIELLPLRTTYGGIKIQF